MNNPKSEFLMSLGRFIVTFSKVQNILQEGIYILTSSLHSVDDNLARNFMHKILLNQLKNFFLTLATDYSNQLPHINKEKFILIRSKISSELDSVKATRNKMMHSVWNEKFWEGDSGLHNYTMLYHKNKQFSFILDTEEIDFKILNDYSRKNLYLESFIHDFLICLVDGKTIPEKNFDILFQMNKKEVIFPRNLDIQKYVNIDSNI